MANFDKYFAYGVSAKNMRRLTSLTASEDKVRRSHGFTVDYL